MSEHTPGPWHHSGTKRIRGDFPGIDIGAASGENIALVHFRIGDTENVLENARLIAAAPDLLAACRRALEVLEDGDDAGSRFFAMKEQLREAVELSETRGT